MRPDPSSPSAAAHHLALSSQPHLSARHALAILVNIQIGSGIFSSPGHVDTNVPSPATALAVWAFSGLLSWAGAASFAELGTILPGNGGIQDYLRYVYGDTVSSLLAWIYVVAALPSSMALQGIVLGESFGAAVGYPDKGGWTAGQLHAVAIVAIALIYLLNIRSTAASGRTSELFTVCKLVTVGGVAVFGAGVAMRQLWSGGECAEDWCSRSWFAPRDIDSGTSRIDWRGISGLQMVGHYSTAVYAGLWAYSGWDSAGFIAGDLKNAEKTLPPVIHGSMAIVMVALEFVNVAYYILLPWKEVGSTNTIAVVAAHRNLGPTAAVIVAALVSIACAGTINSQMFGHGRLVASAAQRGYIPTWFSRLDVCGFMNCDSGDTSKGNEAIGRSSSQPANTPTEEQPLLTDPMEAESSLESNTPSESEVTDTESERAVPARAMLLNATLASIYLSTGSFDFLVKFIGISVWGFLFLAGLGVIILRQREPNLRRPYKVTLAIPIVFCIIAFGMVASSIPFAPLESGILAGLFFLRFVSSRWLQRS
ncbi:amino acid/polyamine transporter I [Cercophora newfieldiana]|uniref:Amino acid/polyamine transporter I n=1 Tax=Cercophora newfieldiana TaxID=92897 RepID=A0AA40CUJ6_9PEZI|nr:amino acid/polyamine transporter I [Cercophora newfieldiana]